jgi:Trk K+ transport system NAD-binding subunit
MGRNATISLASVRFEGTRSRTMDSRNAISLAADGVLGSPRRNLVFALGFVAAIFVLATAGYVAAGWSLSDATYMVTLTIFSVGYDEVHPINSLYLRTLTTGTITLGCTGMIVLTGALVQALTVSQLRKMLGLNRMQTQIDRLNHHTIICGYGRIGMQLAHELHAAQTHFVIIERDHGKIEDAQARGFLCLVADATEEIALRTAGVERAKVLATVLPDDAANVFITLSARNLNRDLEIIARGEAPTTESKLFHAGADKVVMPTHIGAERIAEMILYPATAQFVDDSPQMRDIKRDLHEFGLELEKVTVANNGAMTGETIGEAERRGQGAFFVIQIDRANGQRILHPGEDVRIEAGDHVVLIVRGSRVSAGAVFSSPRGRVRVGRTQF